MSDKRGGKWTAEAKARNERLKAVRQPLSIGVATAANFQPALAAQREVKAVSVLSPGVVPGVQMRRWAFAAPGAFFGGDVPVRLVPMDDWAEPDWTVFFQAAGWSPEGAAAMAEGARPGEFAFCSERKVLVVSKIERQRQTGGMGCWDGITRRVLGEFEKGFEGGLDELACAMEVCRDRVAKAVCRLITRGLVLSNHRRPASYVLSSKGGFANE